MVVGVDVPATAAVASARLRLEQGDLTGVRSAFAAAARGAYDSEHGHRCERGARNEHSLRVGAQVRRIHEESLSGILGEIVGQNAFDDFAVLELRRTHRPSVRGRVVKVLRSRRSESEKSRTK